MPWKVEKGHGCPPSHPWAVVKTTDGSVVHCHETEAQAKAQQAALYATEGQMTQATQAGDCGCEAQGAGIHFALRAVDDSAWDGPAAMTACAGADRPSSCYAAICAGRKAGDANLQGSWALPHHKTPGAAPNVAGCRNALGRLPQTQGLTNATAARRHLEDHMRQIHAAQGMGQSSSARSAPGILRARFERGAASYRQAEGEPREGFLGTMFGHFAVYDQWTEIDSWFEGRFLERLQLGAMRRAFGEHRDEIQPLFQHGRDPYVGSKVLGPPEELREETFGAYYEVPLYDTSYNRDLLPALRGGRYGASFRFFVPEGGDVWVNRPGRSDYNPEGLPERTIVDVDLWEFGPVTFPQYLAATAGVRAACRSLTDWFLAELEPGLGHHDHDLLGRRGTERPAGEGFTAGPGNGRAAVLQSDAAEARDRAWRIRRRPSRHA